jgi:glycine cleavage system H protein
MKIRDLDFPDDLFYLVEHDVWARVHDEGTATVGITAMGIRLSGEIYMCRPKRIGTEVEQGRAIAVVELAKAIVSVKSAVTGMVLEVNEALAAQPELCHLNPYDQGWIARLKLHSFEADCAALVRGEAAAVALAHHVWLNNVQ